MLDSFARALTPCPSPGGSGEWNCAPSGVMKSANKLNSDSLGRFFEMAPHGSPLPLGEGQGVRASVGAKMITSNNPPLVFLHGWGSDSSLWQPLCQLLPGQHNFVDLRDSEMWMSCWKRLWKAGGRWKVLDSFAHTLTPCPSPGGRGEWNCAPSGVMKFANKLNSDSLGRFFEMAPHGSPLPLGEGLGVRASEAPR